MDRHTRKRLYIFLIMVVVGYVSIFEVILPERGGVLKKVYQDNVLGASGTDLGNPAEAVGNSSETDVKQVYYTLAPHNGTKDRVYEMMLGTGSEE